MKFIEELISKPWVIKIIHTIVIVLVNVLLYKVLVSLLVKSVENPNSKVFSNKKAKTYIKLIRSISRYVFIILTFLLLLQTYGINISSIIAGVGVLGVIFGLAIQDWLKDIIRGSSILSDNYFSVGDVVKYKGIEGKVLVIGLKTTKIQDLKTSNILSIANRNIDEIEVVSNLIYVKIPMPYEIPVKKAEKAIDDIIEIVKKCETVEDCKYIGVTELADSSIQYLLKVVCNPYFKLQANRDTLRSILLGLEKNNIEVPFNQIDVHQK